MGTQRGNALTLALSLGEREQLKGPATQGVNAYEDLSEIADGDLTHRVLVVLITDLELTCPLFGFCIAGINLM